MFHSYVPSSFPRYKGKWREIGQKRKGGVKQSGGSFPLSQESLRPVSFEKKERGSQSFVAGRGVPGVPEES